MQDEASLTEQVREIMATTFGMDALDLDGDVSQNTCERWSSLYHMTLLVALEEQFGLSFAMGEMTDMTSLSKIVGVLKAHGVTAAQ